MFDLQGIEKDEANKLLHELNMQSWLISVIITKKSVKSNIEEKSIDWNKFQFGGLSARSCISSLVTSFSSSSSSAESTSSSI